jgi:hypothetical protein
MSTTRDVSISVANTRVPLARRTEGTDATLIFSNKIYHKAQGRITTEDISYQIVK